MPVSEDYISPADALSAVQGYFQDLNGDRAMFRDWCAGTPEGGPEGDGNYPLMDFTGNSYLVPCPARIGATAVLSVQGLASRVFPYYVNLAEIDGIPDQVCFVDGDVGSHIDPITEQNVPNSGMYRYDLDQDVWTRLAGIGGGSGPGGGTGVAQYLDGTSIDALRPAHANATRGAPNGTMVGTVLAQTLVADVSAQAGRITGLEATYGSTQSAANSALAADAARIAADLARSQAVTQRESAQGAALAAAGSASVAGAWAEDAQTAAVAASSAILEVEATHGNVVQAFNDMVLIEGNLHFSQGTRAWTNTYQNAIAGIDMPAGKWQHHEVRNGLQHVLTPISTAPADYLCGMKKIYVDVARRYRVEARYDLGAGTGNSNTSIGVACFNGQNTFLGLRHPINTPLAPGSRYDLSGLIFGTGAAGSQFPVGTVYVLLVAQLNIGQNSTAVGGLDHLTIEDRTVLEEAAFEAQAAAGHASTASGFADNAGAAALSASSNRTAAETAAGNAGTAASTAITQASAAQSAADEATNAAESSLGFATDASNHSATAGGHAQTAQEQASISQTAAAQAAQHSLVAASIASSTSVRNPMFSQYTNNNGPADHWRDGISPGGAWLRVAGRISPYAMRCTAPSNVHTFTGQDVGGTTERTLIGNQYWVMQAEVVLQAGSLQGSGLIFRAYNANRSAYTEYALPFALERDSSDTVVGPGSLGATYRFSKLIRITGANNHHARIITVNHWPNGMGDINSTNTIDWQMVAVRPATAVEIQANRASADLASVIATVQDETNARVAADSALASRATVLEGSVNHSSTGLEALRARIATEESARASGDTANANVISTLVANVTDPTFGLLASSTRITQEADVRAAADTAQATRSNALEARLDHTSTGLGALSTRITNEASARTTADSALATRATNLEASVGHSSTGLAALSSRITAEETARANGDNALAARTTSLEASIGNGTSGLAALSARITEEMNARVNADSANATSINTITTTMNGHTASINSVVSSVNGQRARAAMTLDVNGYITGWETSNNGATGQMYIRADRFAVGAPGAGIFPFRVEGNQVFIHNAVISYGAIDTGRIAVGSIGVHYAWGAGDVQCGANQTVNFGETGWINIGDASGGAAHVTLNFSIDATVNYDSACVVRLFIDNGSGWVLHSENVFGASASGGNIYWRQTGALHGIVGGANIRVLGQVTSGAFTAYSVARPIFIRGIIGAVTGTRR